MIWYFPALPRELREIRDSHMIELFWDGKYNTNGFIDIKKRERSGRIGFEFIYPLKGDIHRSLAWLRRYKLSGT